MRTTILLYLILIFSNIHGQINLDSLKNQLETSSTWTKTKTVDYLMKSFQRFEKVDHKESFDIYIDSTGHLSEYIGLSAVYKQFDSQNRITKRIGYNLKGGYYLWDYSPIETTEYHNDSTILTHYNFQFILSERVITVKDSKDRIVETLNYDKNLKLYSRIVNEYNDLQNRLLIKTYDGNGKFKANENGVAIRLQKFDSIDRKFIVEERFYDANMNLIDADHSSSNSSGFKCEYSILRREFKNKEERISFFNSKDKLQCESDGLSIWTTK